MTTKPTTPIYPCPLSGLSYERSTSPVLSIPDELKPALSAAAAHLRAGRTVAFPTETVYGLGAHSLDPDAVKRVYAIKRRPADNPLIIHVGGMDMLRRLVPASYELSELYAALTDTFWPGPLTLLFPSTNPPPPPAPQTNAIRMPAHPLALALIQTADLPVSAPSANSSGRPSPTQAQHVKNDLDGSEGLGCILDGGACGVGVESTVVDGLAWRKGGGGSVNVLRPGGLGVEDVARVVRAVDEKYGGSTQILLHGRPWVPNANATEPAPKPKDDAPPSTPGMKYRHYSPRIPVFLLLPSNVFPTRPRISPSDSSAASVVAAIRAKNPRLGFLGFEGSPLSKALEGDAVAVRHSLGKDAASAAQNLFGGMLALEQEGVDAILIEGCSDDGLGLAVMERAGKAVGGGGVSGALGQGEGASASGRLWVQV
ncbi:protein required for respiratory growth [Trichosporon asahii var. asahii CBS 8904]|uniref:Threonylcarbamoyl-AMP synthase n=1 Tax=Trichosporon asahii var. asahii (strain CBS 8904) TaxID=1220162 RepID=K1VVP0_TRIAC|nr:protein required for respiratory growth [Trichosporon asahii var. asahii CBS 8904]